MTEDQKPQARHGKGGGITPQWTFSRRQDGFYELMLKGGTRWATIALRPEEFTALVCAVKNWPTTPRAE